PVGAAQNVVNAGGAVPDGLSPERRMSATTITLPQNFQMPDMATLNAAAASAGYTQYPAANAQRQAVVYQQPVQQPVVSPRPYAGITAAAPMQSSTTSRAYLQGPQLPSISQAPLNAGAPPMQTGPTSWNNMSSGQLPQPQLQQPNIPQLTL